MGLKQIYHKIEGYKSVSIYFVIVLVFIGFFSSTIANNKPILVIGEEGLSSPIMSNKTYISNSNDFEIWPLIPYHSQSLDFKNMNSVGPFNSQEIESLYYRHWLGTDELGRDLFAGLIHGCKTAVLIGFGSMLVALLLGLFLGGIAGYYKNDQLQTNKANFISISLACILFIILSTSIIPWKIEDLSFFKICSYLGVIFGICSIIRYALTLSLIRLSYFRTKKTIPVDQYVMRLIELLESIPLLFLIISLSAIFTPSYSSLLIVIGLSSWTSIAKFTRAEVLKIKEQNYIESSLALGLSNSRIIQKHILPNALPPIFISLAFGIASAILIEATLSFLGIGLGAQHVSWGSILANARSDYQSWWLVIFPGILLFFTIYSLNQIGEKFGK